MTILQFPPKADPNMSGEAFCIQCNHAWVACAPIGTVALQCPQCGTTKGRFKFECAPEASTEVRECNCGNQLFYLTREGHLCPNCGIYQLYEEIP